MAQRRTEHWLEATAPNINQYIPRRRGSESRPRTAISHGPETEVALLAVGNSPGPFADDAPQVIAPPPADWTTLLHLAEPNQQPLATGDSPPLNGDYPSHVWAAGEVFNDTYTLTVPDDLANGRYPLWIGMYNSETIERLPLTINGQPQPNQVYQIGTIEIVSP